MDTNQISSKSIIGELKNMWFSTSNNDGGFLSRKLVITFVAMLLVTLGGVTAAWFPAFAASYSTFVGGILGALGLYLTGNVTNKYLTDKNTVKAAEVLPAIAPPAQTSSQKDEEEETD